MERLRLLQGGDVLRRFLQQAGDDRAPVDDHRHEGGEKIELGEIEEALARHPAVHTAAVAVREPAAGEKTLVG